MKVKFQNNGLLRIYDPEVYKAIEKIYEMPGIDTTIDKSRAIKLKLLENNQILVKLP